VRNVKAIIEYDGTDLYGFQKQSSKRTVQGDLETAAEAVFGQHIQVVGAGRTDAGVHAIGQVVNFNAPGPIPTANLVTVMNGRLSADIRVRCWEDVPATFHARRSARARTYVYTVLNRSESSAILGRYAWQIVQPLDVESMAAAATRFAGTRDFASFGMPERPGGSTVRHMAGVSVHRRKDAILFVIKANAFLRGMARAIVGTVVEIGQGKRRVEEVSTILDACDRQAAGVTAPPQGLCLTRVEYQLRCQADICDEA
jgi:tRNA pseudouridine38-40 synthase